MTPIEEKKQRIKDIDARIDELMAERDSLQKEIKIMIDNDPKQLTIPFTYD